MSQQYWTFVFFKNFFKYEELTFNSLNFAWRIYIQ